MKLLLVSHPHNMLQETHGQDKATKKLKDSSLVQMPELV